MPLIISPVKGIKKYAPQIISFPFPFLVPLEKRESADRGTGTRTTFPPGLRMGVFSRHRCVPPQMATNMSKVQLHKPIQAAITRLLDNDNNLNVYIFKSTKKVCLSTQHL